MISCSSAISSSIEKKVGPTDTHWPDFIGYENDTSMSVELGIQGNWEKFAIMVFEGKHSFSLGF